MSCLLTVHWEGGRQTIRYDAPGHSNLPILVTWFPANEIQ